MYAFVTTYLDLDGFGGVFPVEESLDVPFRQRRVVLHRGLDRFALTLDVNVGVDL